MNDRIVAYFKYKEFRNASARKWWENKSTEELLNLFIDKKSRKVSMAAKELCERFIFSMYDEQKKILHAMLESGCKTYRYWAYRKLFAHWDEEFAECICHLWERYKEEYCAWVVIEYGPIEYLKAHTDELAQYDYWRICLRLANDTDFWMEESRLKPWELMYVYTKNKLEMTDEECERLLYMTIAEYLNNPQGYNLSVSHETVAKMRDKGLQYVPQIDIVVWCVHKKNSMLAKRFDKWNQVLQEKTQHIFDLDELRLKLSEIARENFPLQYSYMLATSSEETPSEPVVQPSDPPKPYYRTVSIEEAMDIWKEKNPVFAKFVERFNEE